MNQGPVVHQRWLQAIKENNDTAAYEELYRYCWKDLYQHAARRILDRQDVEDILQELFVQFWLCTGASGGSQHLSSFREVVGGRTGDYAP